MRLKMRGAILFDRAVFAGEHFVLPLHIFCNIAFLINIALDKKGGTPIEEMSK